jgi:hypothetical protein
MMLGYMQNIKRGIVSNEYIFPYLLSKRDREGLKEALHNVKELQGMSSASSPSRRRCFDRFYR